MAIIVGRRDASPLISTAAPVAVPDKTPTEEFAQAVKAAAEGYKLGKDVVSDASDLVTLGTKALQDTPEEKRAAFDKQQAELAENRFQKLKAERDSRFERSARNRDMLQTMGGLVRDNEKGYHISLGGDQTYFDGDDLLAAGDYEGAAKAYEKIAEKYSGPGDKRGEEALRRAQNARNEPVFAVATKLDKDGQYDAAISELQNIAASNPELKDDANFRIELLEEQKSSALTRRKTAMEAETWEEAQRLMKTEDYRDLSAEDAMRKAALDMAAEEMGPRPVLWKEVQTKALIAASQTDPKVRQRMLAEVLTSFDKSGGLGVPISNWYDTWTGDHIAKARANIVNLFKMTPEQAAKVEKTLAEAADKRETMRLRDYGAKTGRRHAQAAQSRATSLGRLRKVQGAEAKERTRLLPARLEAEKKRAAAAETQAKASARQAQTQADRATEEIAGKKQKRESLGKHRGAPWEYGETIQDAMNQGAIDKNASDIKKAEGLIKYYEAMANRPGTGRTGSQLRTATANADATIAQVEAMVRSGDILLDGSGKIIPPDIPEKGDSRAAYTAYYNMVKAMAKAESLAGKVRKQGTPTSKKGSSIGVDVR